MFKKTLTLMSAFVYLSTTAQSMEWYTGIFDFGLGWRKDFFNWSIAGDNDGPPNIFEELKWSQLQSVVGLAKVKITGWDRLYMRYQGDGGWILAGKNRHSIYGDDNRTDEVLRTIYRGDGCWVYDGEMGIGYTFGCPQDGFTISPLAGYSVHGQKLLMRDADVVFNEFSPFDIGVDPIIKNRYKTMWDGGWVEADLFFNFGGGWILTGEAEYHWARFRARGKWRHSLEFRERYRDRATGDGQVYSLGINYINSPEWNWAIGLMANYQNWQTRPGIHATRSFFYILGPNNEILDTIVIDGGNRLNRISWRSASLMLTLDNYF